MASCGYTKYRRFHHVLGIACVWAPVRGSRRTTATVPGVEAGLGRSSSRPLNCRLAARTAGW